MSASRPTEFVSAGVAGAPERDAGYAGGGPGAGVGHGKGEGSQASEEAKQGDLDFTLDEVHGTSVEGEQMLYPAKRHYPVSPDDSSAEPEVISWRLKERMRTVSVALVACLNIRVDPPDVIKPSPCARIECWTDPYSMSAPKALETIGKALEQQYQRWQPRARYKQSLDPTVEDVKKLCDSLRRSAKDERVLFHYNGHGVPKPTANSEIWVFNKSFTQYIPLSVYDLQTWLSTPSILVLDCSNAGVLVNQNQHRDEDLIILAACSVGETLPQNPDLPADVFTACLTTPIKMALRWFCTRPSPLLSVDPDLIDRIPGQLNNRKSVLGELNWIFTAITDTIAWNLLPPDLFQRLFRQDLLVASIFRNFILADRLLRSVNCSPVSIPRLPPSYQHPLWAAWDLAADVCLSQLPDILADPPRAEYRHSAFFTQQLTAFEVWLEFGSTSTRAARSKPLELPIVLQVLLSQVHRLRALLLLARFLDMGSWAVNHALSVGIFPYVLKLLQSPAAELREALVFIWAKILTVDTSCQLDLVRESGHLYFLHCLLAQENAPPANQQALALAVIAIIVGEHTESKEKCLEKNLIGAIMAKLQHDSPHLRRWAALCAAQLWGNYDRGKTQALDMQLPQAIGTRGLSDPDPGVRAASMYALGMYLRAEKDAGLDGTSGADKDTKKDTDGAKPEGAAPSGSNNAGGAARVDEEFGLIKLALGRLGDGSPIVRRELVLFLAAVVRRCEEGVVQAGIRLRASGYGPSVSSVASAVSAPGAAGGKVPQPPAAGSPGARRAAGTQGAGGGGPEGLWGGTSGISLLLPEADGDWLPLYQNKELAREESGGVQMQSSGLTMPQSPVSSNMPIPNANRNSISWGSPRTALRNKMRQEAEHEDTTPFPTAVCTSVICALARLSRDSVTDIAQSARELLGWVDQRAASSSGSSGGTTLLQEPPSLPQNPMPGSPRGAGSGTPDRRGGGGSHSGTPQGSMAQSFFSKFSETFAGRKSLGGTPSKPVPQPSSSALHLDDQAMGLPWGDSDQRGSEAGAAAAGAATGGRPPQMMRSKFFARNVALLRESLLRSNQMEREASEMDQRRQVEVNRTTAMAKKLAAGPPVAMNRLMAVIDNQAPPSHLLLHPHAPLLLAAERSSVSFWHYGDNIVPGRSTKVLRVRNPLGTRISSMTLLNESDPHLGLLFVATNDGVVRAWRGFAQDGEESLVAGFKAMPEMVADAKGPGLVMAVARSDYRLLHCAGESPLIRTWDMESERCAHLCRTGSTSAVTALSSSNEHWHPYTLAGCADGSIRLWDGRLASAPASEGLNEHRSRIISVHCNHAHQVVSGSSDGIIKIWDLRLRKPLASFQSLKTGGRLTALAAHRYAPIIASGSDQSTVAIHSLAGDAVDLVRASQGFLGQRQTPVCALELHPLKLVMAVGSPDGSIALYSSGAAQHYS